MSSPWFQRKTRLRSLLKSSGDEDAEGLALDRILHGQNVIGTTSKTTEIDALRFGDKDLSVVGTLEYGQFGVIDVVTCHLDGRVYVRKSTEKRFALRTRDQCSPQFERDILLLATKKDSSWVPHLLCAFQTPTHLNLVMDYAEGGTLWDVLESSPHDGRVHEDDLKWWSPQIVSAIHWCHSQGFAHRDIKPHNFVLTCSAHILLIDFGSAAPLTGPDLDGSRRIHKRYCIVPCGTCDYISPEILQAHEEALVALEMSDNENAAADDYEHGYGLETDWWSLGAMLFEMVYGITPFFAKDIRQTYLRIMDHKTSLTFNHSIQTSGECQDLLQRLLTSREQRIGRRNIMEITDHPFFNGVDWDALHNESAPSSLQLPQFTYSAPRASGPAEDSHSQPFAFSAFFQSSKDSSSPGLSILHTTPGHKTNSTPSSLRTDPVAHFIGFSWGPTLGAFPPPPVEALKNEDERPSGLVMDIPRPLRVMSTPNPLLIPSSVTPAHPAYPFSTPLRPNVLSPYHTLPRASAVRSTTPRPRREVSDREAMKQLVDCVGMSARKKVLEGGRKPRLLASFSRSAMGTLRRKELRFDISGSADDHVPPLYAQSESEMSASEGPPSPSPSPRPGSALSMTFSMAPGSAASMTRRSSTPTLTTSSQRLSVLGSDNNLLGATVGRSQNSRSRVAEPEPDTEEEHLGRIKNDRLDELDERHAILMSEISHIERQLGDALRQISGYT